MLTDAYNLSHDRLKINTDWEVSHIYNRSAGMILYGFKEMATEILNIQISYSMIEEARLASEKLNIAFPTKLFNRVVDECNGYFPIMIQSLKEGTWCPTGTPFAQIRNTEEGFGELVTWLEGVFLHSSFPCGTATEALHLRRYLEKVKHENNFGNEFLNRFHSFGFRGHRSLEDAYWAGTSWNMFLHGTDDFHTMIHTPDAKMGSISALAHKVTQQYDVEYTGYIHTIDATYRVGEKVVALVIDTYDADRFIDIYLIPLSKYAKKKGIHLVIRPDSGDVMVQAKRVYFISKSNCLDNISVLIGEGMSLNAVAEADKYFMLNEVPLDFISYGIGGGFYNHINRDTLGLAMKTAYSNGSPRMKFGMEKIKRSIPDAVYLTYANGGMVVCREPLNTTLEEGLYDIFYYHCSGEETPFIDSCDYEDTKARAMSYVNGELQDRIVLSDGIQDLIKQFEKKYLEEESSYVPF